MKTKINAALTAFLFLLAFSCSKDSANTSGNSSNRVSSSQTSYARASSNDNAPISIVGQWILYYDWDCDGYPGEVVVTFNADGTWNNANGYTGLWITGKHLLTWMYDNSETTYSGAIGVKQVHGIQSTFEYAGSLSGCFHLEPFTGKIAAQKDGNSDDKGKSK